VVVRWADEIEFNGLDYLLPCFSGRDLGAHLTKSGLVALSDGSGVL
jgi:hypothetical protein